MLQVLHRPSFHPTMDSRHLLLGRKFQPELSVSVSVSPGLAVQQKRLTLPQGQVSGQW